MTIQHRHVFTIVSVVCSTLFCAYLFQDVIYSVNSIPPLKMSVKKNITNRDLQHSALLAAEQQKATRNLNDITAVIAENSDPLPPRNNSLTASALCSQSNNGCIPKFRSLESLIRIAPNYKMVNCVVQKSMSTIMTAIFCFLFNEKEFLKKSKGFYGEWSAYRLCKKKNEYNDLKVVRRNFGLNKKFSDWSLTMLTRDPVERFISGYVDKCVRKTTNSYPCNGCGKNMTCFIEREYKRMLSSSRKFILRGSFEDRHFYPQNWRCNLHSNYENYKFIKYSSSNTDNFLEQFIPIAKAQKVPQSSIDYLVQQMTSNRTVHSTVTSPTRTFLENRLRNSPYLMEYVVKMFYHDFLLFKYKFPEGF